MNNCNNCGGYTSPNGHCNKCEIDAHSESELESLRTRNAELEAELEGAIGQSKDVKALNDQKSVKIEYLQTEKEILEDTTLRQAKQIAFYQGMFEEHGELFRELCSHSTEDAIAAVKDLRAQVTALESEIAKLRNELKKAVRYLREGKQKFSPNTTNSDVDVFLEKHKES